jgi:hypothetical protein
MDFTLLALLISLVFIGANGSNHSFAVSIKQLNSSDGIATPVYS